MPYRDGFGIKCTYKSENTGVFPFFISGDQVRRAFAQALRLLPTNISSLFLQISLTPYVPVPETNGEEWDRLESASALDALTELIIHGEYNGLGAGSHTKHGLELRTVAAAVFEVTKIFLFVNLIDSNVVQNIVCKEEIKRAVVQAMLPAGTSGMVTFKSPQTSNHILTVLLDHVQSPRPTALLHALASPPNTTTALDPANIISTQLATLLFSHLLRSSSHAKASARLVVPGPMQAAPSSSTFFVPADDTPLQSAPADEPDDDEAQTLLQILSENLSLSLLSRSRANTSDREAREWDRYVVGYLCLLSQWLWEDPKSVRDFLEAGGLGVVCHYFDFY
jgi:hypothetical protein